MTRNVWVSSHVQPIKSGHVPATSEMEFPFIALSAQIPTERQRRAEPGRPLAHFIMNAFLSHSYLGEATPPPPSL